MSRMPSALGIAERALRAIRAPFRLANRHSWLTSARIVAHRSPNPPLSKSSRRHDKASHRIDEMRASATQRRQTSQHSSGAGGRPEPHRPAALLDVRGPPATTRRVARRSSMSCRRSLTASACSNRRRPDAIPGAERAPAFPGCRRLAPSDGERELSGRVRISFERQRPTLGPRLYPQSVPSTREFID